MRNMGEGIAFDRRVCCSFPEHSARRSISPLGFLFGGNILKAGNRMVMCNDYGTEVVLAWLFPVSPRPLHEKASFMTSPASLPLDQFRCR